MHARERATAVPAILMCDPARAETRARLCNALTRLHHPFRHNWATDTASLACTGCYFTPRHGSPGGCRTQVTRPVSRQGRHVAQGDCTSFYTSADAARPVCMALLPVKLDFTMAVTCCLNRCESSICTRAHICRHNLHDLRDRSRATAVSAS